MAGLIVGFFGFQRSGKTLLAYKISDSYYRNGIKVYTNMEVEGFIKIKSLAEIPNDYTPKVLLLDEIYYFLDSRMWQNNTEATLFLNTLGKRNIMLLMTAINPGMIELRLREQMNYVFICKGDDKKITYKVIDVIRNKSNIVTVEKNAELFENVRYNTLQVPDFVDCSFKTKKKFESKGVKL